MESRTEVFRKNRSNLSVQGQSQKRCEFTLGTDRRTHKRIRSIYDIEAGVHCIIAHNQVPAKCSRAKTDGIGIYLAFTRTSVSGDRTYEAPLPARERAAYVQKIAVLGPQARSRRKRTGRTREEGKEGERRRAGGKEE